MNIAYRTRSLEVLAGRAPGFWGDGWEGSILLGRTAPPLDMLRLRTIRPIHAVPGTGAISRLHGSTFLAWLRDEDRTIANPLLHGMRLEWEPTTFVRVGASRTILMGGDGRTERFRLADILDILLGRHENKVTGRDHRDTDQKASLHGEIRLPAALHGWAWLTGPRLFYEYAGEDFDGFLPTAAAHHQGGSIGLAGWMLLFESAEMVDDSYNWYTHMVYGPDAYRHEGFLLGHPAGTDGWSLHLRLWSPELASIRTQAYWKRRTFDPEENEILSTTRIAGLGFVRPLGSTSSVEGFVERSRTIAKGGGAVTDWRIEARVQWARAGALR
jgi:hypothetical protein